MKRLIGQDVEVILIVNGEPRDTLTAIKSFEVTFQNEIKDEGFLGETTNRKDTVFNGIKGRMEMQTDNKDLWVLFKSIVDKSRSRQAGTRINIKATMHYPNGDNVRVIVPDAEFGELPFNVGSRTDYAHTTLDFAASEMRVL
jgi:hypothetical protein